MEHHASVTSLVIVLIVAFITPILLHRLRLNVIPVVVAEIIMGLIIGKSGFNIVHPDSWLEILSTLGFIFLMFLSGVEIDFSAFAKNKKKDTLPNGKPGTKHIWCGNDHFYWHFCFIPCLVILVCIYRLY